MKELKTLKENEDSLIALLMSNFEIEEEFANKILKYVRNFDLSEAIKDAKNFHGTVREYIIWKNNLKEEDLE